MAIERSFLQEEGLLWVADLTDSITRRLKRAEVCIPSPKMGWDWGLSWRRYSHSAFTMAEVTFGLKIDPEFEAGFTAEVAASAREGFPHSYGWSRSYWQKYWEREILTKEGIQRLFRREVTNNTIRAWEAANRAARQLPEILRQRRERDAEIYRRATELVTWE